MCPPQVPCLGAYGPGSIPICGGLPERIQCQHYTGHFILWNGRGPVNDAFSVIALPPGTFEQGDGIRFDAMNPCRIEEDARDFIPYPCRNRAKFAAVCSRLIKPFGTGAAIGAEQANAGMVDMKAWAHGTVQHFQPHPDCRTPEKVAVNPDQKGEIGSEFFTSRRRGQQMPWKIFPSL